MVLKMRLKSKNDEGCLANLDREFEARIHAYISNLKLETYGLLIGDSCRGKCL